MTTIIDLDFPAKKVIYPRWSKITLKWIKVLVEKADNRMKQSPTELNGYIGRYLLWSAFGSHDHETGYFEIYSIAYKDPNHKKWVTIKYDDKS